MFLATLFPHLLLSALVIPARSEDNFNLKLKDNVSGDGFWCQQLDFKKTEVVMGLSSTTGRVRGLLGSNNRVRRQRVAVLVRGEAYRLGSMMSARSCAQTEVEKMIIVLASFRARVLRPLGAAGFKVDVLGITYDCEGAPQLNHLIMGSLQPWLRRMIFIKNRKAMNQAKSFQLGLHTVMDFALKQNTTYDGILVLRFDTVVIAEGVLNNLTTLNRSTDAFLFPFSSPPDKKRKADKLFSDTFLWIPWPALPCFLQAMHDNRMPRCFNSRGGHHPFAFTGHDCYPTLLQQFRSAPVLGQITAEERIGVMAGDIDTAAFVSNTANRKIGANPVYITVPRSFKHVVTFLRTATDVQSEVTQGTELWENIRLNRTFIPPMSAAARLVNGDMMYDMFELGHGR